MQHRFSGFRWSPTDFVLIAALLALAFGLLLWIYRPLREHSFTMNSPDTITTHRAFHGVETFPDGSRYYRWTTGNSRLELPNAGGMAIVHIALAGGPAGSVPVALRHDTAQLALLISPDLRTYSMLLPPAPGERINLSILSPVVTTSERAVGVVVSDLYLAAGAVAPPYVVLIGLLGVAAGYGLLRGTGWRSPTAASYTALLLGIAVLWQRLNGWQYGLFAVLLVILAHTTLTLALAWRAAMDVTQARRLALIAILINSIFYTTLYFALPVGKLVIFREDSFVENVTAAYFGLSAIGGLALLLRSRHPARPVLAAIPLFALICLLDEMSFGERFFAFNMPIFYDVKLDGLHDIVDILVVWLTDPAQYRVELAISGAIGVLAALVLLRSARRLVDGLRYFRSSPAFIFFAGSLGLLVAALLIDTELYPNQVALGLVEELLELNAATGLLFAAGALTHALAPAVSQRVPSAPELRGSRA